MPVITFAPRPVEERPVVMPAAHWQEVRILTEDALTLCNLKIENIRAHKPDTAQETAQQLATLAHWFIRRARLSRILGSVPN